MASSKVEKAIAEAREAIKSQLETTPSNGPQFIRIAFYDAITYNPITKADGPNGSIRVWEGIDEDMKKAIAELDKLKANNSFGPYVSYADLYQLAGTVAVEKANGPKINLQPGRVDSCIPMDSSKLPIIKEDSTAEFVKNTFHGIGFTSKEMVALSSAYYYWMNYDKQLSQSEQPKMDNTYFEKLKEIGVSTSKASSASTSDASLGKQQNKSNTKASPFHYWNCLTSDASLREHVELFAKEKESFAKEYASAHKKLSELGFKHFPEAFPTEEEYKYMKHGISFAVAMTILFGFVGFFYEVMRI